MTNSKILGKILLHTCYSKNKQNDAVVVSELICKEDGSVVPNLRIIQNPKRSIYITKKKFQTHALKKERECIEKLDKHVVLNKNLNKELFKLIHGYAPRGYVDRSIFNNPYIYGGSASIEYLVKRKYVNDFKKTNLPVTGITVGGLDTEYSLLPDSKDELVCLTVTHENKVYTSINVKFFNHHNDKTNKLEMFNLDDLKNMSYETLTPLINSMFDENESLSKIKDKANFSYEYHLGIDEVDTLKWVFEKIHKNKTSFINIWNMGYDIPMMIQSLERHGVDPKTVFCSPEVPDEFKTCFYKKDRRSASHITDIWNWLSCTSYTQFYDSMAVYAKLRTVKGKESSYALDYILKINNLEGKLKFNVRDDIVPGSPDWHRYMVKHDILRYIVYNQADSIWLQLLMWAVKDPVNFYALSGITPIEKTFKQTVYVHDSLYNTWEPRGWIFGTVGTNPKEDKEFTQEEIEEAIGGAVLSPYLISYNLGMTLLDSARHVGSAMVSYCNDLDFSQMYPRVGMTINSCKETKQYTAISINGNTNVEKFFSLYANHKANAIHIAKDYFSLPGYDEMEALVLEELKKVA